MLIKEHYSSQAKIWNLSLFCWPPMLLETEPQLLLTPKGLMRVNGMDRIIIISKPSHYQILSFKLLKHGRFLINYRFLLLWVELKKGYEKYQIWSNSQIYVEESFHNLKKSKYWVSIKLHGFSETPYFGLNIWLFHRYSRGPWLDRLTVKNWWTLRKWRWNWRWYRLK